MIEILEKMFAAIVLEKPQLASWVNDKREQNIGVKEFLLLLDNPNKRIIEKALGLETYDLDAYQRIEQALYYY